MDVDHEIAVELKNDVELEMGKHQGSALATDRSLKKRKTVAEKAKETKMDEYQTEMSDSPPPASPQMLEVAASSDSSVVLSNNSEATDEASFARPKDWPAVGVAIDLAQHDLPHASSDTEWWYVNAHVKSESGKQYSFFASFFRIVSQWNEEANDFDHMHALSWAIVDCDGKRYHPDSLLDKMSPHAIKMQLDNKEFPLDRRMERAFREVAERNAVPLPDHMFTDDVVVPTDKLSLNFSGNTFIKKPDGTYVCKCVDQQKDMAFTVSFKPKKKPIRHGHNGVVKIGLKGDDMFYYFIPRCEVKGSLTVGGETHNVTGNGWYDHEFGGKIRAPRRVVSEAESQEQRKTKRTRNKMDYAWNWISVQLNDGTDITATTVLSPDDNYKVLDNFALIINKDSSREEFVEASFTPAGEYISVRTGITYPTKWNLSIPEANTSLNVQVEFEDQEFITLIAKPAFWEGRVRVSGVFRGQPIEGLGFVERHGFHSTGQTLEKFFKTISGVVNDEIDRVLPLNPTYEQVRLLMADSDMDHYMDGVDTKVFADTIIKPIRDIVDRGGKSWRSYALLLCVDAVGGYSPQHRHWLAMPELMHVGSLIVDDIQDESETRRGGPCAHLIHGVPLAINAGTAAYFISLHVLKTMSPDLTPELQLMLYQKHFLTLRAAHAGQAFDIAGLDHMMDEVVRTGDNDKLLRRVVCTHRLKSAVPAGNLARVGTLVGGGSEEQVERMGRYFESIGVAFQVIDDVLNLRGLPGKTRGEDIMAGKVTYPVAVAMNSERLNETQRKWLWELIQSKPQDQKVVDDAVELIRSCGALDASEEHANTMVGDAWKLLDVVLPDSFYKMRLRAFGWFVLERHY